MELLHQLFMDRHDEIRREGSSEDQEAKVIDAYELVKKFANVARREGLLALEECAENLDQGNKSQELFSELLILVVDGTEPKILTEIGFHKIIADHLPSYDGLISLLFLRGSLMIQEGVNPYLMDIYLKSMMPVSCKKLLAQWESRQKCSMADVAEEQPKDKIRRLCEDEKEPEQGDYGIVNQAALALIALSDRSMERLLREIDNISITVAMKGMPGKARKRIFDNVSTRLGIMLAEDMSFMGPVRMKDVEAACHEILKKLLRLEDRGEIAGFDTSVLKIVMDVYDRAEKNNRELREQYKDIKQLIEEIYRA